jgi:hypothetical protein
VKRFLLLSAILVTVAALSVGAQSTAPTAGDFGVGASVSSSTSQVQLFYHATDSIVVSPQVGFFNSNVKAGSTDFPDNWWHIGAGVYYVVRPFQSLSVQVGPQFLYSSESYKNTTTGDNFQRAYWEVDFNLQLMAMINKNLGVFTAIGLYYYSNDVKDTTAVVDTQYTGYGIANPSLGVVYYFK